MIKFQDNVSEIIEQSLNVIEINYDKGLNALAVIPRFILENFNRLSAEVMESIHDQLNHKTPVARLIRYGTLPWSKLILEGYKYFYLSGSKAPIFHPGVHMVRASVGGGKSLLSYILAELYRMATGLGSYFTSPVEKPRITEDGRFYYVYHRVINLDDYFRYNSETKELIKIKKFNTKKYKCMHKDERHLEFNPRENTSKEYKERFIAQQKDEILMRHQGITHIYKYTQYMKLDGQDMQALTYMHDVSTYKDIPLERWLEEGTFNIIPLKLKIKTYKVEVSFDGSLKRKKIASYSLDVPYEVLQHFDTHAEAYRDDHLQVDYS